MSSFVSYAQNYEDLMLWRALRHVEQGFYVDCGAYDPEEHSVTKAFYERGWSGINIEPVPSLIEKFVALRPRDSNLAIAVAERAGLVTFHEVADTALSSTTGLSTLIADIADRHSQAGFEAHALRVPALKLSEVLRDHAPAAIHFLKIDVEGAERSVLAGAELETWRPWICVVEATSPLQQIESHSDWEALLLDRNYEFVYFDGLNRFYVAAEHAELKSAFRSPPNIFDNFIQSDTLKTIRERDVYAQQTEKLQTDLSDRNAELEQLQKILSDRSTELEQFRQMHIARTAEFDQLRDTLDEQTAELSQLRLAHQAQAAELARTKASDIGQQAKLSQLSADLHRLQASEKARETQVAKLHGEMEHLRASLILARTQADQMKSSYEAVLASTSWQLTAPIRKAKTATRVMLRSPHEFVPLVWRNLGLGPKPPNVVGMSTVANVVTFDPTPVLQGAAAANLSGNERYAAWIAQHEAGMSAQLSDRGGPSISVLIVADAASASGLSATIDSLQRQNRDNWQVVVGFSSEANAGEADGLSSVRNLAERDTRIQFIPEPAERRGVALRAVAERAFGEFVMVLDPGDILPPYAIAALAHRLESDSAIDILYADEDILENGLRTAPQFKPGWSPELLTAYNYFGRPTLVRRTLIDDCGNFAEDLDAACEWDLHLRSTERFQGLVSTPHVQRLPLVLCHRHSETDQDRALPGRPAAESFRSALTRHWARQGISAKVTTQNDGTQHAAWDIAELPLASIIIPNKNRANLLRVCLDGLMNGTTYRPLEIIVVDNGSTEDDTLALYQDAEAKGVRIVPFDEPFNYSKACNLGAAASTGEILLFLNNDIEVVSPDWLTELVRYALLPGVGVVGTKLVYPNGVLQHAGVVVGMHLCGLVFNRGAEYGWGPFGSPSVTRNWLGIMGACQMVRRDVFERINGFDETYKIAMSDIKLTLDAWRAGYRTVCAPAAKLVHHEGASRGHSNPESDIRRTAADIRAVGIEEDPYFHPGLSATLAIPTLRLGADPSVREDLKATIDQQADRYSSKATLNLCDDGAVANAVGLPLQAILWVPDSPSTVPDALWAARLLIDLLRRRPDLRTRFPKALSEGSRGKFAEWLKLEGIARFGLPEGSAKAIDEAFALNLADKSRQVALYDDALRAEQPFFLLPQGRRALSQRLFAAVAAGDIERESAWWMLMEAAEDPARELVNTYQFTPDWQEKFPDGTTRFGRAALAAWLVKKCDFSATDLKTEDWPIPFTVADEIRVAWRSNTAWSERFPLALSDGDQARAFLRFLSTKESGLPNGLLAWSAALDVESLARELTRPGVNIFGHFSYPSGLRTSTESIIKGLHSCGVSTALRNVRVDLKTDEPLHDRFTDLELFDVSIVHVQPEPFFEVAVARSGLAERRPRPYRIGYWYWEFDEIPKSWDRAAAQCNELWTATNFVGDGLKSRYDLPVHVFLPGLELPSFTQQPREYFNLPEKPFIFLFTFHMTSIMERKNPLGLIEAFRRAFGSQDDALLVIKTSFGARHPSELAKLYEASQGLRVKIIDEVYSQDEMLGLMKVADAYVSLHRSEGLGLTMAETMLLGKPVIATRYSGNLDFMDDQNSLLVDYKPIVLDRDHPPYEAGLHWAEPSLDHAAQLMRRLYEDRLFAHDLGAGAEMDLRQRLSYANSGRRMAERLATLARSVRA